MGRRSLVASLTMFAVFWATMAQNPQPCDPPAQLTFRALQYDHEYLRINRFRGMYDATNMRVTFLEDMTRSMPGKQYYQFLYLYAQGVAYEFNMSTKKCVKGPSGKFKTWGIPFNSTLEDVYVMGGPGESFEAVEWSDRLATRSESWVGIYTMKTCYPVSTFLYANENVNRSMKTDVFDIMEGLSSPSDFIPPEQCTEADTVTYAPFSDKGKSLLSFMNKKWIR